MTKARGIYFFHIPKTSGMSVWRFLDEAFPKEQTCPWWLWDQLIAVPKPELERWNVFRGHFLSHLEPYLGRRLATFTMLRDPVERTISHYSHVLRAPEHPFHPHALRMPLAQFCADPKTNFMVGNYQAAYLAKSPRHPAIAAQAMTEADLAAFKLQEEMQYPDRFANPAALFENAKDRLNSFAAVGFAEEFTDSMGRIARSLGCPEPAPFEAQNVNPERVWLAELDRATLDLIHDLTEVDRRLYQHARSRAH